MYFSESEACIEWNTLYIYIYEKQRHTNLIFEMIVGALVRSDFYADEALVRSNKSLFISVGRILPIFRWEMPFYT